MSEATDARRGMGIRSTHAAEATRSRCCLPPAGACAPPSPTPREGQDSACPAQPPPRPRLASGTPDTCDAQRRRRHADTLRRPRRASWTTPTSTTFTRDAGLLVLLFLTDRWRPPGRDMLAHRVLPSAQRPLGHEETCRDPGATPAASRAPTRTRWRPLLVWHLHTPLATLGPCVFLRLGLGPSKDRWKVTP